MKIVRHTAPDIRTALRSIREQLGEEAVILSSHRTAQGVEITAAIDFDAGKLEAAVAAPLAARAETDRGSPIAAASSPPEAARTARAPAMIEEEPPDEASAQAMGRELQSLRRMLETQLAQLAWNDRTRRAPVHAELLRELTEIGIARDLADHLVGQLDARVDLTQGRRFAIAGLSQYLLVTGDRWLESGGRVAFVGATGVGKTTLLAKLAVRWILRHGTRDLALVASDNARIGAQDQMQALGQLLGVPVHVPDGFEALPELLSRLGHHRMVLIDTPGSSLRDAQLDARLAVLANCASLETALVLAASTQAGALEEAVQRFRPANPASCLLTQMDEAASLGGALSVLIRARLPLAYTSDGQRVPEDLRPARSLELVSHAVRLARSTGAAADEDLLRRRFGRLANG
jgi:flagellar biosynthesis protein FlhF